MDEKEQTTPPIATGRYREILSKRYPDRQFADDTEAENAFYDDYQQSTDALDAARADNRQIYDLIEANPTLADVIQEMITGTPFEVALARHVDLEALVPQKGEPNFEAYTKAVADRKSRTAEIEKRRAALEVAQVKSKADAEAFFAEMGMDDAEQKSFIDFVEGFVSDLFRGEVSKTVLKKMYQAYKYDEAVAEAAEQGSIDGRNQTIETRRTTTATTDGIPVAGSGIEPQGQPVSGNIIASIAARSAARKQF